VGCNVKSQNLERRHLDESQRSIVAAKLADMQQGERTDLEQICSKLSLADAAEELKVGRGSVVSAKKVLTDGAVELVEAVEQGAIPVSTAAQWEAEQVERRRKADEARSVAMVGRPYAAKGESRLSLDKLPSQPLSAPEPSHRHVQAAVLRWRGAHTLRREKVAYQPIRHFLRLPSA
jgi:hypothetical protein